MLLIAFTSLLLFVNLAGLGLLCRRWVGDYAIAKVAGIVGLCLVAFSLEHYVGLGPIHWAWLLTTPAALWIIHRQRPRLAEIGFWQAEKVFALAYAYGFGWRFLFPDIYPTSERVTNLFFISNYLGGETLPPTDRWNPTQHFDYYYSFQHYAAGLMARIFGLDGGNAYQYAFGLLTALTILAAWVFARSFLEKRWQRWLVLGALIFGGTGLSPMIHLLHHEERGDVAARQAQLDANMWASMRFAGNFDQHLNTGLAERLFHAEDTSYPPGYEAQELPIETFSYLYFVGDYHPPSGGFLLLMLGLGLIGLLYREPNNRVLQGLLAATPAVAFITNAWIFPFQFGLVACWVIYSRWQKQRPDWMALALGTAISLGLLYPFLLHFSADARGIPLRLVRPMDHTPMLRFVLQQWPLMLLIALGLSEARTRKLTAVMALGFLGMLVFSECVFLADSPLQRYARTNSVMKWWSWIYVGGTMALGTLVLASPRKWARMGAVLALVLPLTYAYDIGRYLLHTPMPSKGQLSGHAWLSENDTNEEMLDFLHEAPDGIVLESQDKPAYTQATLFALFTGKTAMLGWPAHLATWHGRLYYTDVLYNQVKSFYAGAIDDPADWLAAGHVSYVVWLAKDEAAHPQARDIIGQRLVGKYDWHPFGPVQQGAGIWVRRDGD